VESAMPRFPDLDTVRRMRPVGNLRAMSGIAYQNDPFRRLIERPGTSILATGTAVHMRDR